jgi:hypothetical protein
MAMYSFISPFCEVKFCGESSCVSDKLGCAAGEKRLWNTALEATKIGNIDAISSTNGKEIKCNIRNVLFVPNLQFNLYQ